MRLTEYLLVSVEQVVSLIARVYHRNKSNRSNNDEMKKLS